MIKDKNILRVLVIEDNQGDFVLIEDYLLDQVLAPQITHVKNFKDADAVLSSIIVPFDIILLDLSLPDKSGETLIADIMALCPGCPVIILTGYGDIDFSIKSLSLGVADYLLKDDINSTSLYKSIVYTIERKKASQALEASEKRFSNLFHLSPQPMYVFDPETLVFVQVNKAAVAQYGYSEDEFLTMTLQDIKPHQDYLQIKESLKIDINNKENVFAGRFRHYKKSKEIIDVDIYSNPVTINDKLYTTVIAIDVTEKVLYEHRLTKAIIKTQEDERYEIGSELHDNVCQLLATSKLSLGMLKTSLLPPALQWFDRCSEYIMLASEEIRNLSHRLAPAFFDDTTLEDTFRLLLNNFNVGEKYKIYLYFDTAVKNAKLSRDIQLNLYRVLQEQLRNILKYANASSIEVEVVVYNNELMMRMCDDGVGFDKKIVKKGIGLANMKRRAELFSGKIEIESSPGMGCEVVIKIPMEEIDLQHK